MRPLSKTRYFRGVLPFLSLGGFEFFATDIAI
jgi:hypothetical protein